MICIDTTGIFGTIALLLVFECDPTLTHTRTPPFPLACPLRLRKYDGSWWLFRRLCWLIRMRQRKWKLEASTGWVMLIFYLVWFIASIAKDSA